ncbi:MAG TPA: tetratricopeptide repeat protein [Thermoanaerobaculia bacterium]|nr:tetratricopeptide repeat protein [Thermoanaerobaculia bacterium]
MNTPTDWISALAILAAGLVLGALFVFLNKRRNARTLGGDPDLERKDLEAKRDALVAQLRDPGLEPDERTRLEVETANVLRRLDAAAPARTGGAPSAATPATAGMNPTTKGFLWGAGSFAALGLLFYFVMQQAAPRQEGGSLTGGDAPIQQPGQAQGQAPDPALQQLQAAVQRDPENLQLRNDLAQAYLERDNMMAVFEQTNFVLQKSPEDSRALTFQGLVRMAMGDMEAAVGLIQRATKSDPRNLDSWVSLAWIHAQNGNMAEAEKMIAEAAKNSPADKPRLDDVFAQMKQHIAQQKAQPAQTAGGELPPNHPPIEGAPSAVPPAAAPAAAGPGVRVTLDLDSAAQPRTGIVFVIARNPAGGPPLAVKRVIATSFPLSVDLTAADSMMGQPLPVTFRLEARLDRDGDPMTRPATDPAAAQNEVSTGMAVRLALK